MSLSSDEGRAVHFPANPEKFAFDREVSAIFPDMAVRSIPNFLEAHEAHARMLKDWIKPGVTILDVGASRGHFLQALIKEYRASWLSGEIDYTGIDNSADMCNYLKVDFPEATVRLEDVASYRFLETPQPKYDVICVNYVLQFIDQAQQASVLLKLIGMVKPGGVMIIGHKARHHGVSGDSSHEEYIRFRMARGYTREEIEAKTKALKGAMFPMDHGMIIRTLSRSFHEVTETFRFMMFSTIFAVK